jgi:hypothetical protein
LFHHVQTVHIPCSVYLSHLVFMSAHGLSPTTKTRLETLSLGLTVDLTGASGDNPDWPAGERHDDDYLDHGPGVNNSQPSS